MKPRNTLIVLAAAVLLVWYAVFVENPLSPDQVNARLGTPTATPESYMFQLDSTKVKSFMITDLHAPRTVTVARSENGWTVTQPENKPADNNKAEATASALADLKVVRTFSNVKDISAYGINKGILEARVIMDDGAAFGVIIGSKTPDGAGYYAAYTGDQSKVFMISPPLVDSLTVLLDSPPFQPTVTPTPTATPPVTPTVEATPIPPGFVPTLLPTPATTPKP